MRRNLLAALCFVLGFGASQVRLPVAEAVGPVNYWVQAVYVEGPNQDLAPRSTHYALTISGVFLGSNVDTGGVERFSVQIAVTYATTPVNIRAAVIDAVQAEAVRRGYTVARNAGLIPSFERGS
jgi:hypothetical protein